MNSDDLGEKGEQKFAELCVDVQLIANKSTRDRLGWDYVVTWPLEPAAIFDSRPPAINCHVQLKTVWAGNDAITLNLGTLEHIVKDTRPAFVVVLEVSDVDLSFVQARVIHIADDFLAAILKRLREAQVAGKRSNEVSFQASAAKWGVAVPSVTGAGLKQAMESVVPAGMADYARLKELQLSQLGFEAGRFKLRAKVEVSSVDEAIDGFLGLAPLKVTEATRFDTRFGIDIETTSAPWPTSFDEEPLVMKMRPERADRCTIAVSRTGWNDELIMKGEIFVLPAHVLGPDRFVMEARSSLLRIRVDVGTGTAGSTDTIVFAAVEEVETIAVTAAEWAVYFRLASWAHAHALTVKIKPQRTNGPPAVQGGAGAEPDLRAAKVMSEMANDADIVEWAMLKALAPGTKMTSEDMQTAAQGLELLQAIERRPETVEPLRFTTGAGVSMDASEKHEMLFLDCVPLGSVAIAFAVKTTVTAAPGGDVVEWESGPLQLTHVRKIKTTERAFAKFAREATKLTGVRRLFGPGGVLPPV